MARVIKLKRNDTWLITGTRTDSAGDPVSLSGNTVAAQMKFGDTVITLDATVTDAAAGEYQLEKAASGTDVALLPYQCDVEFISGSSVASSETFTVVVEEDITNAS